MEKISTLVNQYREKKNLYDEDYFNLGKLYEIYLSNEELAKKYYRLSLKYPKSCFRLGRMYLKRKSIVHAIYYFHQGYLIDDYLCTSSLAIIFFIDMNYKRALHYANKALKLKSDDKILLKMVIYIMENFVDTS